MTHDQISEAILKSFESPSQSKIIGSGLTGTVYYIKVPSFECEDVVIKSYDTFKVTRHVYNHFNTERKIYKYLETHPLKCTPQLVYDGYFMFFRILCVSLVPGEVKAFRDMNTTMKDNCYDAIVALHDAGIVHGDIRHENFVVSKETAFVIDFGMSKLKDEILNFDSEAQKEKKIIRKLIRDSGFFEPSTYS